MNFYMVASQPYDPANPSTLSFAAGNFSVERVSGDARGDTLVDRANGLVLCRTATGWAHHATADDDGCFFRQNGVLATYCPGGLTQEFRLSALPGA